MSDMAGEAARVAVEDAGTAEIQIRIWYSAEKGDECFVAQVVEWPGIMAHGETREEAARQIQIALDGALEVAAERGIKPPAPALAHI